MTYPHGRTVCQRGGETLFEIERTTAAALKAAAELYTPDGRFVVAQLDALPSMFAAKVDGAGPLQLGGARIEGNYFGPGIQVGIDLRSDGSIRIGGMG